MSRLELRDHVFVTVAVAVAAAAILGACGTKQASLEDTEAEGEAIVAAERDPRLGPTDHGTIALGSPARAELTHDARGHAWTFALAQPASVTLRTVAAEAGGPEVDTVLSLYREGDRGWGRPIARNDDTGRSVFSALARALDAGRYRVVVTGYDRRTRGAFALASTCRGGGCGPAAGACLFGDTFQDLRAGTAPVRIASEEDITRVEQLADVVARAQLVVAVQQSSHTDVRTPEEALARVDEGTVRRVQIPGGDTDRAFVGYEYGAGDNSYGAIFAAGTTTVVASIHDGDFERCTARVAPR